MAKCLHALCGRKYKCMTMDSYNLDAGWPCVPLYRYNFGAVGST